MKKTFLTLIAALTMVGCVKNELEAPVAPELGFEPEDIVATLNAETKTSLGVDGSVLWSENDRFTLLYKGSQVAMSYQLKSEAGSADGTFGYAGHWYNCPGVSQTFDKFYGIYPEMTATQEQGNIYPMVDGKLQVTIPDEQTYVEGSFDRKAAVMTGISETSNISFTNATGLLKIFLTPTVENLPEDMFKVESIILESNAKLLAGAAEIVDKAAVIKNGGVKSVTLTCSQPVTLDAEETFVSKDGQTTLKGNSFIIALPPTEFEANDLKITVNMTVGSDAKNKSVTRGGFSVARSLISTVTVGYSMDDINAGIAAVAQDIEGLNEKLEGGATDITLNGANDAHEEVVTFPKAAEDEDIAITITGEIAKTGDEKVITFVNAAHAEGNEGPATLTVSAPEGTVLIFNTPQSHVTINGTTYERIEGRFDVNTLVIPEGVTVKKLVMEYGSASILGTVNAVEIKGEETVYFKECAGLSEAVYQAIKNNVHPDYVAAQSGSFWNIVERPTAAKIGDKEYKTLAAAVEAATSGQTVTLAEDVDITTSGLQISNKAIIIDLNGQKIKSGESEQTNVCVKVNSSLTVIDSKGEGKIYSTTPYSSVNNLGAVNVYGTFVLESGLIEAVLPNPENNGQFGVVAHYGAHVTINGGTVRAGWYALATNGQDVEENIITINGGNIISVADYAIYNPAQNSQVIINGGVVSGAVGAVALNGGSMNMTNGVLTTKGIGSTGDWSDGTGKLDAAAINVNAKYTSSSVTISGGQVIAEGNTAVFAVGTANAATISITGGSYSSDPSAYVATGYEATEEDGVWTVAEAPAPAGLTTQEEFVAACAAAVSGDEIVLGAGEFAIGPVDINGKTLTFKGQGADKTTIYIGNGGYDGNGGHGSSKTANMTFVDVTLDDLADDSGYLTGFTEAAGLTFRNVTFNVGFSNWGNKGGEVSFYNCTFNQKVDGKYNVQELRSANNTHYLFDGCTFNSAPGRFINAYKQGGASAFIEIIVKDCAFKGTTQSKAALNLKSGSNGCSIDCYFLGKNTVDNVKIQHSDTGSALFADQEGTAAKVFVGTTKDDAVCIWENKAKTSNYVKPEEFTPTN